MPWIITKPAFTVRDAMAHSGGAVTFQAMNTGIKRLIDLGMVIQRDGNERDRLFTAPEVVGLFEPVADEAAVSLGSVPG